MLNGSAGIATRSGAAHRHRQDHRVRLCGRRSGPCGGPGPDPGPPGRAAGAGSSKLPACHRPCQRCGKGRIHLPEQVPRVVVGSVQTLRPALEPVFPGLLRHHHHQDPPRHYRRLPRSPGLLKVRRYGCDRHPQPRRTYYWRGIRQPGLRVQTEPMPSKRAVSQDHRPDHTLQLDISGVALSGGDYAVVDSRRWTRIWSRSPADGAAAVQGPQERVGVPAPHQNQPEVPGFAQRRGVQAAEVRRPEHQTERKCWPQRNARVLCNSMLLTEGWDCPSVDCVVVLRPTKVRSLYSQMVGRGTRLEEGQDPAAPRLLWMTNKHELCHPAGLCEDRAVRL